MDVVAGPQAPAHEVEHPQEVGEVAVVVEVGRVVDAEVDSMARSFAVEMDVVPSQQNPFGERW
jgi:hypothetical protein